MALKTESEEPFRTALGGVFSSLLLFMLFHAFSDAFQVLHVFQEMSDYTGSTGEF